MGTDSSIYEKVTRKILDNLSKQLGFSRVEGKSKFPGTSGTKWEIEASCYKPKTDAIVLVECRRKTTSKVKQEEMAGFAYRIKDIGAISGIMVTPIGYQEGTKKVAQSEKIGMATLNPDATEKEYILTISNQLFRGLLIKDSVHLKDEIVSIRRICSKCRNELVSQNGRNYHCPHCET